MEPAKQVCCLKAKLISAGVESGVMVAPQNHRAALALDDPCRVHRPSVVDLVHYRDAASDSFHQLCRVRAYESDASAHR